MSRPSPVAPSFRFRAERPVVGVRPHHFLAQGQVVDGVVRSGSRIWVHLPSGATLADVVEIQSDGEPASEARLGRQVGLLLRGRPALSGITVGTGISDSPDYVDAPPPPKAEPTWQDFEGPEALEWLRTAPNSDVNAFASNRFDGTPDAIRFVESLYAAGAARVIVNRDNIVDEGGDLYADALVVLLPQDRAARSRVVTICKHELDREAGSVSSDAEWATLEFVFLWWD